MQLAGVRIGRPGASRVGTGGMASKLDAARIASGAGVPVLLAAAEQVAAALAGERVGTAFPATARRTASRLFWLRHATTPRGQLVLDAGAVDAAPPVGWQRAAANTRPPSLLVAVGHCLLATGSRPRLC